MAEIKPFTDVKNRSLSDIENKIAGTSYMSNLKKMSVGAGDNVFRADQSGHWAGASKFVNAPFSVDMAGNVVANAIDLGGAYIATGGALTDIGSLGITSTYIANDAIETPKLAANAVVAAKIDVAELSAISADLGSITAGVVTGATVRTASSGARFEISGTKASSYNSSAELVRLDGDGLGIFGTGGNTLYFKDSSSGTNYGAMGYDSSFGMFLGSNNNKDMFVVSLKDLYFLADESLSIIPDREVYISPGGGYHTYINSRLYVKEINLAQGQSEGAIRNVDNLYGYNDLKVYGNGEIYLDPGGSKVKFAANLDVNNQDIDAVDTIWAYTYGNRSDKRLKDNIVSLGTSLENILELNPVSFNWKKNDKNGFGLIAQEIYGVIPDVVKKADDGYLSIDYVSLIPFIIKAIQELYTMQNGNEYIKTKTVPSDKTSLFIRTKEELAVDAHRKDKDQYKQPKFKEEKKVDKTEEIAKMYKIIRERENVKTD